MFTAATHSLRERKKAKTRETIVRVALSLFAENGYSKTTIAQIAEAAEVSPRTVSTYFPAKEDIVFDINVGARERLARAIEDRPEGVDSMDALRAWLLNERELMEDEHEFHVCQRKVIDNEESLQVHEQAMMREFELILANGLATDLDLEVTDLQSRMAAAAATAVFDVLRDEGKSMKEQEPLPPLDQQLELLDQALAFITGGVLALRERQG